MNLIIHIDEIFLKGSNQPLFYRRLIENLEKLLQGVQVHRIESGLWLENFQESQLNQLALIPGFANYAEAIKVKNTVGDIKKGVEEKIEAVKKVKDGNDETVLRQALDALQQEIQKIGAEMYKQEKATEKEVTEEPEIKEKGEGGTIKGEFEEGDGKK
ncbi:MAG: hypothetical protein UW11_C0041G0003 [Parcubacteria group bacterium GW2011_GWA2_43_9b]|nr:MAG: hypothetical protein UW11_C0041G0003 [Parcubacteria group bacterium GW2011_GWA2_43_9b]